MEITDKNYKWIGIGCVGAIIFLLLWYATWLNIIWNVIRTLFPVLPIISYWTWFYLYFLYIMFNLPNVYKDKLKKLREKVDAYLEKRKEETKEKAESINIFEQITKI